MNDQASGKRVNLLWLLAIVACVGVAAYSLTLRLRADGLARQRDALRTVLSQQLQGKQRLEDLVTQARAIQIQQSSEMRELKKLQKRVTTRDQFFVTSGDKIVRQLAVYAPSGERRLIFYVPSGEHRLFYAIREVLGTNTETRKAIAGWGDDHRLTPDPTSVRLSGGTVYELRTLVDKSTRELVSIQLIGSENKVVHEDSFPLSYPAFQGLSNLQNDSEVFASYPNELRSAGAAKSHIDAKRSAPVTPLLTFTLDQLGGKGQDSKGRAKLRFWIDSNSPPCMSDVSAAASYGFLSSNLRYAPRLTKLEGFNQTFQPHDGSVRYYFTDGYFSAGHER